MVTAVTRAAEDVGVDVGGWCGVVLPRTAATAARTRAPASAPAPPPCPPRTYINKATPSTSAHAATTAAVVATAGMAGIERGGLADDAAKSMIATF